jgi:hypothetical protein
MAFGVEEALFFGHSGQTSAHRWTGTWLQSHDRGRQADYRSGSNEKESAERRLYSSLDLLPTADFAVATSLAYRDGSELAAKAHSAQVQRSAC